MSFGVDLASQLQTVRVGQISVGRGDGEDDGVGLLDVLEDHVSDLSLDIARLISDGDLGQPGQIDQGQGQNVRGVDSQVNGGRGDASISADLGLGLPANLIANLMKVVEFLAGNVQELAPFVGISLLVSRSRVGDLGGVTVRLGGSRAVDQLQD